MQEAMRIEYSINDADMMIDDGIEMILNEMVSYNGSAAV